MNIIEISLPSNQKIVILKLFTIKEMAHTLVLELFHVSDYEKNCSTITFFKILNKYKKFNFLLMLGR